MLVWGAQHKTCWKKKCSGLSTKDYFVSTLVESILSAIQPKYESIKVCLTGSDSHELSNLVGGDVESSELNQLWDEEVSPSMYLKNTK